MEELNSLSLAKSILSQGTSLTDAVKSGKAIQDAIKDLVADPNNTSKKIPSPPKTLVLKSVWNSSQRYLKDEMVSYNDRIWLCLRDNFNIVPEDDASYWIQPSSNDIKNIQDAPALPKIANDINSATPEEGEIVYVQSVQGIQAVQAIQATQKKKGVQGVQGVQGIQGGFFIGTKDGSKVPFSDNSVREVEGPPTAKNKGNWGSKKKYAKNDIVAIDNKLWVAEIDPPVGTEPSEENGWYPTENVAELPVFEPPVDLPDPPPPPPPPIYKLTPSALIVDEGDELTFNVTGSDIEDGTYYWTTESIGVNLDSNLSVTLRNGTTINLNIDNDVLAITLRNATIINLSINNNLLPIIVRGANDSFPIILRNGLSVKVEIIDNKLGITLRNNNVNSVIVNNAITITLHDGSNSIPITLIDGSSITYVKIKEISQSIGTGLSILLRNNSNLNLNITNNLIPVRLFDNSIINLSITNNLLPVVLNGNGIAYVSTGTANVTLGSGLPINLHDGTVVNITINNNLLSIILRNGNVVDLTISNNLLPVTLLNGNITNISIGTSNAPLGSGLPINLRNGNTISLTINNNLLPIALHNGTTINITISNNLLPVTLLDGNITNVIIRIENLGLGLPVTLRNGINIKVDINDNILSIILRNGTIVDIIIDDSNSTKDVDITNGGNFGNSFGTFEIIDNVGSFKISPTADLTTEGNEKFIVSIRSSSISGVLLATSEAVTINDTSLTPVPPHTKWNASVYYLKEEIVEFCGLFYKAKINTFRTIPSRSPNDWERRYY